jgi:anti-sigma factor RsiW
MRCTSVLKRLPLFAGGDLASPQCEQIERHLASCFACARAYAQTLAARDALHQLGARSREPGPWEETGDVLASRGGDETFFARMRDEIVSEAFATVGADDRRGVALVPRRRFWFGSGFLAAGLVFLAMGFVLACSSGPARGLPGRRGPATRWTPGSSCPSATPARAARRSRSP